MNPIWTWWDWSLAATRSWFDMWLAVGAACRPAPHVPRDDAELPCADHDLFA